jgi:hypothetical protein
MSDRVVDGGWTPLEAAAPPPDLGPGSRPFTPPSDSAPPAAGVFLHPPRTLDSLQFLRAWAAFIVVVYHVGLAMHARYGEWHLPGFTRAGLIGFDVFFCISGFIMYYKSGDQFAAPGAWRTFLARGFLRVYPRDYCFVPSGVGGPESSGPARPIRSGTVPDWGRDGPCRPDELDEEDE